LTAVRLEEFRGIIAATITPNTADESEVSRYLDLLERSGVRGLFILGTMGEGAKLGPSSRQRLAEMILGLAGKRFLKIVHVGAPDIETAEQLARHAGGCGADAVSAVMPYYYRYDAESLAAFYNRLAGATEAPLLLYNNPGRQGYSVSAAEVARVFELAPGVRGIKDTSGDPAMLLELQTSFGSTHFVACGGDHLLHYAYEIGVRAHVSSLAAIYPEIATGIWRAASRGDHSTALRLQDALNRARTLLRAVGPDTASYRYALRLRGIDLGPTLFPTRGLTGEEMEKLSRGLEPLQRLAEEIGRHG
jgi:dihydrodipicolinate synthase/N-acetylneuraminate lyase